VQQGYSSSVLFQWFVLHISAQGSLQIYQYFSDINALENLKYINLGYYNCGFRHNIYYGSDFLHSADTREKMGV